MGERSNRLHDQSRVLHTGIEVDPYTKASSVPIYQASTYHWESFDEDPKYDYSRSLNPTREAVEHVIAEISNANYGYAFATGMAAISAIALLLKQGECILASNDLYGGTYRLLTKLLPQYGIATIFVDTSDLNQVEHALQEHPNIRMMWLETPSNPTLSITDIRECVALARRYNDIIVVVDNTFMSPILQKPLELGADLVVESATKFLGGHSDLLGGTVVANDEQLAKRVKFMQNACGGTLSAHESWLLMRGIKTLYVRVLQSQQSASKIAEWLQTRPEVERLFYPGLKDHIGADIHQKQAAGGGMVVSFDVGSREKAIHVMKHVKLPIVAVSLGAVETILSYPARMSHAAMSASERQQRGVTDGLMRFSVGLEDANDLIEDLAQAFAGLA
jgi:cystathionine beta-lyase